MNHQNVINICIIYTYVMYIIYIPGFPVKCNASLPMLCVYVCPFVSMLERS